MIPDNDARYKPDSRTYDKPHPRVSRFPDYRFNLGDDPTVYCERLPVGEEDQGRIREVFEYSSLSPRAARPYQVSGKRVKPAGLKYTAVASSHTADPPA